MGRFGTSSTIGAAALLVATVAMPASPIAAQAPAAATPIASGFAGPLNIGAGSGSTLYVADTFGGKLFRLNVRTGRKTLVESTVAPSGVSVRGGRAYITGSTDPGPGLPEGATFLSRVTSSGRVVRVADLLAYEKAHNPDGQKQCFGKDCDALSNPYAVLALPGRILVGDAAGNDVLEISSSGRIRTVVALPLITVGKCRGAQNNDPQHAGCDPVPTGLALGPDGVLYVSGLGAEVAGRIWKVDIRTGKIHRLWGNLPPLTGIAVTPDGSIYASSLFTDSVFRIAPNGARSVAKVPKPTGLARRGSTIYAASQTGQIFLVPAGAFH